MAQNFYKSSAHPIGFDPLSSSPAPVQQGLIQGYFDDPATRLLLGLSGQDILLNSRTYGVKELGQCPIEMHQLHDGGYDQRLMPFVPCHHTYHSNQLALHNLNRQWIPLATSVKSLEDAFTRVVNKAQTWAECTSLNLPTYAYKLVPKLCYKLTLLNPPFPMCTRFGAPVLLMDGKRLLTSELSVMNAH